MDWSIFALLQMSIITVGVSLACWLRMRAVRQQNEDLRRHLTEVQNAPADEQPTPEEWLQASIDGLPAEAGSTPIVRLVAGNLLHPDDGFDAALTDAIRVAGLGADGGDNVEIDEEQEARIAALEAELEAARAALDDAPEEVADDQNEDLKTLLQQFTRDSRDMLMCIQTLEAENAELREQLDPTDAPQPAIASAEDAA